MKRTFFFTISVMLFSCAGKDDVPSGIIKPGEMQSILWDVVRAQVLSQEIARKDSAVNEVAQTKVLSQKVFELHNTTAVDFDRSYSWYTDHPDMMKNLFDSLSNQNQRQNELKIKHNKPLKLNSFKKYRRAL